MPAADQPEPRWTPRDSARLYGIDAWGAGYLGVTGTGTLAVCPDGDARNGMVPGGARSIDLRELTEGLRERGVNTPVLLRFNDVLDHRLRELREAFDAAAGEQEYRGGCMCVYPVKVNQARQVVEEVRNAGAAVGFGLEVGSKPELLAVMALTTPERSDCPLIVCNGFKDAEYIEAVAIAAKLGRRIVPVVERPRELDLILEMSAKHGVELRFGARVKPSSLGAGRWQASGGMRSKFGLTVSELLAVTERLVGEGRGDRLAMLHFHIGSQVCDILSVKNAVNELARTYTELKRLGAGLGMIDVGGGLGVDYDGSSTNWSGSMNYSVREYAADVVHRVGSSCDDSGFDHPMIVTESGRAMVAYASVLVCDVLGMSRHEADPDLTTIRAALEREDDQPQPVLDLIDAYERLGTGNPAETHHDAVQARDEAASLYGLGYMSLPMRAAAERLFVAVGLGVLERTRGDQIQTEELEGLPELVSDIAYANLSVFQSLPDSWAIDQIFPICPIHRLDERPDRAATIADITCDSDGQIRSFSAPHSATIKHTLELHSPREGEHYDLGFFLVGAYQEVLGDLHNLIGDTHAVHVRAGENGRWRIEDVVEGDTVAEVLAYVQYDAEDLRRSMRRDAERAVAEEVIGAGEARALLEFYDNSLKGYTYLS